MSAIAIEGTMLYCPKCQSKYEDGSQRFCNNDGGRLLPVKTVKSGAKAPTGGVFTNLLGRSAPKSDKDERLSAKPRFKRTENTPVQLKTPAKSKIFKSDPLSELEDQSVSTSRVTKKVPKDKTAKPGSAPVQKKSAAKVIQSSQVPMSQAKLGDRKTSPEGRTALTWQNPRALLGQVIKGRYHVAEKLSQDQTSIAYLAEDGIVKGKKVVVRVLMQETSGDNFQEKVFAEERVSLSHINHPNITSVIDSGDLPEGKPFIITEYLRGESVADVLKKTAEINPMRTARIIRQASLALSEVHQNGILHRDLKPENILLTVTDAGVEQVKVTDFCVSDGKPRIDNLGYKSPEQLGRQLPSYASDSYSLAVVAHRMLTGQLPFADSSERALIKAQKSGLKKNPSDLRDGLSSLIDNILAKGLSYNPADRYPRARDFGEALFNAITTSPPWEKGENTEEEIEIEAEIAKQNIIPEAAKTSDVLSEGQVEESGTDSKSSAITSDFQIASSESGSETDEFEAADMDTADEVAVESSSDLWKRRSPDADSEKGWLPTILYSLVLV
ncbi:MAG: serine/threonine protein kinase, partial [Pyrinomonadaceae bacterium]|nr:serine/threonine protein kinase [Pyrinomonadaceae bacterium]